MLPVQKIKPLSYWDETVEYYIKGQLLRQYHEGLRTHQQQKQYNIIQGGFFSMFSIGISETTAVTETVKWRKSCSFMS